jgi:hypothetical protein
MLSFLFRLRAAKRGGLMLTRIRTPRRRLQPEPRQSPQVLLADRLVDRRAALDALAVVVGDVRPALIETLSRAVTAPTRSEWPQNRK